MDPSDVIRRQAVVLCGVASSRGAAAAVGEDLDRLAAVFAATPGLGDAVDSPSEPGARRALASTLDAACGQALTREFVRSLARRRWVRRIPAAAAAYREACERRAGTVRVDVVSAAPLPAPALDRIARAAAAGRAGVRVATAVDPALIAGFRLRIGDTVHDYSAAARLARARRALAAAG